jgi:Xaa-Pro aminopeptidase
VSDEPVNRDAASDVTGARFARVRARMAEVGVEVLLLSTGADLPWLTGYEAMPLERLTMLVLPTAGEAVLVVPRLEAPRVTPHEAFRVHPWDETEDPVALVARLLGGATQVAVGDRTWARFVVELIAARPDLALERAVTVTGPLRMVKDAAEIAALQRGADAVDAIALALRERPFAGRSELEVSRELVESMLAAGHERANFAIVATGPNGASPHHDPTDRVITPGDVVLCDFGGTMRGYCSDITRMFVVGEPSAEVRDVYDVLVAAQEAGVQAGVVGAPCEAVDAATRAVITDAGYGDFFVHRTGHGIGTEEHEDPYMVTGNTLPIVPGFAWSVEPGIYLPGRFGLRLEDIVVATVAGPRRLTHAPRDLAVVH